MHFTQQVEPKNLVLIGNLSKFAKIARHFEQPRLKKSRKRGAAEPPPAAKRRRTKLAWKIAKIRPLGAKNTCQQVFFGVLHATTR